ncbi:MULTISPECIES: hypothetical protein [unclassified Crossiella]|uniref:hypothetical protein n=1 Tax=unclassified Crossiella TaxID=2620835 RepID=UPI001FFE9DA1|nr:MULTISPECIES: hypothetical protein [unclassified Crossiella]MCK2240005.1 hypothetical protein [Crossiella sp. S99.2]MCK2252713.1 hypothetical protein [Crossiella sp. S99.1]
MDDDDPTYPAVLAEIDQQLAFTHEGIEQLTRQAQEALEICLPAEAWVIMGHSLAAEFECTDPYRRFMVQMLVALILKRIDSPEISHLQDVQLEDGPDTPSDAAPQGNTCPTCTR